MTVYVKKSDNLWHHLIPFSSATVLTLSFLSFIKLMAGLISLTAIELATSMPDSGALQLEGQNREAPSCPRRSGSRFG
jgi:hypothetical protein